MITKRISGAFLALALLGLFCGSALGQETKELTLTLEDSIVRALKNNLNVAAEVINPGLASANVSLAKQMYSPTFQTRPDAGTVTNRPPPVLSRRTKPTSTTRRARPRRSPRGSPSAAPCRPP